MVLPVAGRPAGTPSGVAALPGPAAGAGPAADRRAGRPPLVLALPALLAAAVALLPMIYLAVRATERGLGEVAEVLLRDRTAALVLRSLGLAATVTAACLVIGVSLAG
ncbi:MAG TPA: hypothetical protein VFM37_15320, partial [Pseudonocardiaceae bacterium]|nr:hypothetical protein [Pseudonocardiaceae bacterium]